MSKTYESLEPQGHFNFAKRVFQKIKGYIDSKVQTDVPANATFTDTTYTATGNIDISQQNVISRKEVWLDSFAEYEALQNPDPNTDYHVPAEYPFPTLPLSIVNGALCITYDDGR